ncbi:MAG: amidohydrolase family protein [Beijerinckiaceae bacterium]
MASDDKIDVHVHFIPPDYQAAAEKLGATPAKGSFPEFSEDAALKVMDENGIATSIMSMSAPGYRFCRDAQSANDLARRSNDWAAGLVQRRPDRFGLFASLPFYEIENGKPGDVGAAVAEAVRALDELKLDGVGIFSSYGPKYLGDPVFDPLLAALNARSAVVHIHPMLPKAMQALDLDFTGNVVEFPFDTTRVALNLVFSHALERYPNIRYILSHGGGTLPFIGWRVAWSPSFPAWKPDDITKLLKRFWVDTALSVDEGPVRCWKDFVPMEQVLFGNDFPFAPPRKVAQQTRIIESSPALDDAELKKIARGNALTLFPRLV